MLVLGYVVFALGSVGALSIWRPLRQRRIDLGTVQHAKEGSTPFATLNVLNPKNYDAMGRRLVRWLYVFTGMQLIGIAILMTTV